MPEVKKEVMKLSSKTIMPPNSIIPLNKKGITY